jgi:peptidyl-prolyl cis-trans isomerase A (cyclophilin A)
MPTSSPSTASTAQPGANPKALLEIVQGDKPLGTIVIELDAAKAPISVYNFARYVTAGYYNGLIFHRVIPTFMIQGGGYTPDVAEKTEGLLPAIENEWENGLRNDKGTIAMARVGGDINSATAQFFINVQDNARLSAAQPDGGGYAVFGHVTDGMNVVEAVRTAKTIESPKLAGMGAILPAEPIIIKSARIEGGPGQEVLAKAAAAGQAAWWQATFKRLGVDGAAGKLTTTATGIQFETLKPGSGDKPAKTAQVTVHYTLWLLNGRKLQSTRDTAQPATFKLNELVPGWKEGVGDMQPGERRILVIPPDLGYGPQGRPPQIPGNSRLIFDVELISVK